jgi:hypothetical protein
MSVPIKMKNTKLNKKFWEELMTYFPLIRHGLYRKRFVQLLEVVFSLWSALNLYKQDNFWLSGVRGVYTFSHTAR